MKINCHFPEGNKNNSSWLVHANLNSIFFLLHTTRQAVLQTLSMSLGTFMETNPILCVSSDFPSAPLFEVKP